MGGERRLIGGDLSSIPAFINTWTFTSPVCRNNTNWHNTDSTRDPCTRPPMILFGTFTIVHLLIGDDG